MQYQLSEMMMVRISIFIALFIPSLLAVGQDLHFAELDENQSIQVGKNRHIPSQFSELPVVEPHISAHPENPNHLLVAAMVVTDVTKPYQSCRLSSFVSSDGGISWEETAHDWWGYDPWTAILPDGNTVMTWLGTEERFKGQFPLQFFSSSDGGKIWSAEVQEVVGHGHGHDGTKVTALNDQFYFTTVRFNEDMGADVVLYRRQGGSPFEEVAMVDAKGIRLNFCEPTILTDGTVLVPSSHFLDKLWVQAYHHGSQQLGRKSLVSSRPGGAGGYMRMVADIGPHSKYKDRIYFVRALGRGGKHEGVWLNYSDDKGITWSRDARIDLFGGDSLPRALVPSIAVNQQGVIGISWVDSQLDPAQKKKDVYFTASQDGGRSFQRPVRVSEVSSSPATKGNDEVANRFPGGGHYLGIAACADGAFQLVWSDSRYGKFELQTATVEVNID